MKLNVSKGASRQSRCSELKSRTEGAKTDMRIVLGARRTDFEDEVESVSALKAKGIAKRRGRERKGKSTHSKRASSP